MGGVLEVFRCQIHCELQTNLTVTLGILFLPVQFNLLILFNLFKRKHQDQTHFCAPD